MYFLCVEEIAAHFFIFKKIQYTKEVTKMAAFKCKMCGGMLEIGDGSIATCDYCGTTQTVPKCGDEVTENLFNRANNLRLKSEFDKAEQVYEKILEIDNNEAEAHWGIVLCKYGIEYVEDPKTFKRIPTCHRTSYEAITANADYLAAIENADMSQRSIYENEAKAIDEIQKNILKIVKNEEPFDVFICYKETDENGKRTLDSSIANDIYHQLTQEGFKVFYAAITLESKLGQEYEPYIFSALNSSKVMLAIGTKPEYFNAVWVKNEWSRYLKLMSEDRSRLLIPCYRNMDAYDLPEEFAHFQAQDMGKIGFINDIVRGIKKVVSSEKATKTEAHEQVAQNQISSNIAPLLERAFMFLEDGDFARADEFCEQVLNQDPKCAEAYLGKLMAEHNVRRREDLKDWGSPFDSNNNYQKALRFADSTLQKELIGYIEHINKRNENARLEGIYTEARNAMNHAIGEVGFLEAARKFESIKTYKDSATLAEKCIEMAEIARKDAILSKAQANMSGEKIERYEIAIKLLESIPEWKNADEKIEICKSKIRELKIANEKARIEAEKRAKRNKKIAIITTPIVCAVIVFVILLNTVIIPTVKYNSAVKLMDGGEYAKAASYFADLGNYKDSYELLCNAVSGLLNSGNYEEAASYINSKDCAEIFYNSAVSHFDSGKYEEASYLFSVLNEYKDSANKAKICEYMIQGDYKSAVNAGLTHLIIPDGVTSIGKSAFENCSNLKTVTIPDSVTHIGDYAFYECSSLESITIPDNVRKIPDNGFYGCSSLASITIPDCVTYIGNHAFWECINLTSVTIPNSVTNIGDYAFFRCGSLNTVYYGGKASDWDKISIGFSNDALTSITRKYP